MVEITLSDAMTAAGLLGTVAASHFALRSRVLVLEERVRGYAKALERILVMLERIEEKLENKEDRK